MVKKNKYKWLLLFLAKQVPFVSTFIILIFSFVFAPIYNAKSTLVMIPIFFWAMEKNSSFDFVFVMLFGFIQDFMDGTQFGLNIFLFLSLYFMIYYQKFFPIDTSFAFSYLAFSLTTLLLLLLKYFLISSMFIEYINFFNIVVSWAILILSYPLLYWILQKINLNIVRKYINA